MPDLRTLGAESMKYELVFTRNGCFFSMVVEPDSQESNPDILAEALADTFGAVYLYKKELPGEVTQA